MLSEIGTITTGQGIIDAAKNTASAQGAFRVAVAAAEDVDVLIACSEAAAFGIANFTLYGSEARLNHISEQNQIDFTRFTVVNCDDAHQSAYMAAQAADKGEVDVIQKGFLSTSALLKTVLSRDFSLRAADTLNHVAVLGFPGYHKLLGITDGGMVVKPTFEQKIHIIRNTIRVFHMLGYDKPRVAVSAPIDYINSKIPATEEAARLTGMQKEGIITGCEVYGPITFDAATNRAIAIGRGIKNYVAGDADILLVDSIEECNIISKVLILLAPATFAGLILGARVPVSLVSRTDTAQNKLASIAIACLMSRHQKATGNA
jgi:phosphate butyryltransferase